MATRFVIGVLAVLSASPLLAATDLELLEKRVQKYALTDPFDTPRRSPCVCQDGGGNHGYAGVVTQWGVIGGKVAVTCYVLTHDGSGNLSVASSCDTFEVLAK